MFLLCVSDTKLNKLKSLYSDKIRILGLRTAIGYISLKKKIYYILSKIIVSLEKVLFDTFFFHYPQF
jgi:hypothetical protein